MDHAMRPRTERSESRASYVRGAPDGRLKLSHTALYSIALVCLSLTQVLTCPRLALAVRARRPASSLGCPTPLPEASLAWQKHSLPCSNAPVQRDASVHTLVTADD